jgi:hypothetical protein
MATRTSVLKMQEGTAVITDSGNVVFPVPVEVVTAFRQFMGELKQSGSITIHLKAGVVAGVETNTRKVLK